MDHLINTSDQPHDSVTRLLCEEIRRNPADQDLFQKLHDRVAQGMYWQALAITGERDKAEDVVQTAFVYFWQNIHAFPFDKPGFKPSARLMALVGYRAIDALRKKKRSPKQLCEEQESPENLLGKSDQWLSEVDDELEKRELERLSWKLTSLYEQPYLKAIEKLRRESRLDETTRRTFFRVALEDKTPTEIDNECQYEKGLASQQFRRVARWIMQELNLLPYEEDTRALLILIVKRYERSSTS